MDNLIIVIVPNHLFVITLDVMLFSRNYSKKTRGMKNMITNAEEDWMENFLTFVKIKDLVVDCGRDF